jgi:hypothetical protein
VDVYIKLVRSSGGVILYSTAACRPGVRRVRINDVPADPRVIAVRCEINSVVQFGRAGNVVDIVSVKECVIRNVNVDAAESIGVTTYIETDHPKMVKLKNL